MSRTTRKEAPPPEAWNRPETLQALSRLAGGLAHDLNNLLAVINGSAGLLLATAGLPAPAMDSARRITAAGERAANLTRQLLLFSGQQPWNPQVLDLNGLLREWADPLRRLAGPGITLHLEPAGESPLLNADPVMLEHLFANLVANARDALPGTGRISLTTRPEPIGPADAARHPAGQPGEYLRVDVTDNGTGIDPEDLPHIFEPFFTTRPVGHGTGLGLAVAFGIVELHGGWLEVDSQPGAGTTVSVFLPAAPAHATPPEPPGPADAAGHETILLVEDDDLVRETTAAVLRQAGYRVLQATAEAGARETWQWHSARIALLLTDVVLPDGMGGIELAEKLRAEKPGLKVVCTSGFSREMMARLGRPPAGMIFLPKPCLPPVLLKTLRTLLDGSSPPVNSPTP